MEAGRRDQGEKGVPVPPEAPTPNVGGAQRRQRQPGVLSGTGRPLCLCRPARGSRVRSRSQPHPPTRHARTARSTHPALGGTSTSSTRQPEHTRAADPLSRALQNPARDAALSARPNASARSGAPRPTPPPDRCGPSRPDRPTPAGKKRRHPPARAPNPQPRPGKGGRRGGGGTGRTWNRSCGGRCQPQPGARHGGQLPPAPPAPRTPKPGRSKTAG